MSDSNATRGRALSVPTGALFRTILLHGCRFKAHHRDAYPYDIMTEGGGLRVATVHGDRGDSTDENAACLAASAEMLTALVDLMNAHHRGLDLPWGTAKAAILAGFGAPKVGARFVSRHTEHAGNQILPAGTIWDVVRLGYSEIHHVLVRLSPNGAAGAEIEHSLDELRLSFAPVEA